MATQETTQVTVPMALSEADLKSAKQLVDEATMWIDRIRSDNPDKRLSEGDILQLAIFLMSSVQKIIKTKRNGKFKKTIVLYALSDVIKNNEAFKDIDAKHKSLILDTLLPGFIDVAVGLALGKIDIGKLAKKFGCC